MNRFDAYWKRRLQRITGLYSLLWLLAANLVGLWLASLLVWPQAGDWTGELTYGRWMPLHMDWHLYGWCALPLVGLLMGFFLNSGDGAELHLGFGVWSLALLSGGVLSLQGVVSGKLFLNWSGWGRVAFPTAQVVLWAILAGASWRRWKRVRKMDWIQWGQVLLLPVLLASPIALFLAAGSDVYPPVDPDSGGATGHSLLASSLGIVGIFGVLPWILRVSPTSSGMKTSKVYALAFVASIAVWAVLDHGNASNRSLGQILGLGVLLLWVPLIVAHYRSFNWQAELRLWLLAFFFWWGLLTVSGFITFLPGVLDFMKFTNGLVAHAHLAMAGMVSAFNMLLIGSLAKSCEGDPWTDRSGFWLWQIGTLIYVLSMLVQGVREGADPMVLFGMNPTTVVFYRIRWFGGILMVVASFRWLFCFAKTQSIAIKEDRLTEGVVCSG